MAALDGSGVVGERQLRRRRPPLPAPSAVLADEDERGGQGGGGRGEEDELSHLQAGFKKPVVLFKTGTVTKKITFVFLDLEA